MRGIKMTFICGCCGEDVAEELLIAPDNSGQATTIAHCAVCCALTPIYPRSHKTASDQEADWRETPWAMETEQELKQGAHIMRGVINFYRKYLPTSEEKLKVYDIGAGRGYLIAGLLEEGYDALACEPSLILSSRAREVYGIAEDRLVTTDADNFLDIRVADAGAVKVVFLWHVLEHMTEPVRFLTRIREILTNDGVVICQGPLLDPAYVYPEHFFLHTESNISWLAKSVGLKLLMMDCESPERLASFVMAHPDHPEPAYPQIWLNDRLVATGSLYFTLSRALRGLRAREP
jgi:SAM-dependent methyltransferase